MLTEYEVRAFEIAMVITMTIHVAKFVIVELKDLWVFVRNEKWTQDVHKVASNSPTSQNAIQRASDDS